MPQRFLKQFKKLEKIEPNPAWSQITRNFLVNRASHDTLGKESSWAVNFRLFTAVWLTKLIPSPVKIVSVLVIFSLVGGIGLAAEASYDPYSSAYALKRVVENVQLALITSPEGKAKFNLRLVDKRTEEIIKLAVSSDISTEDKAAPIKTVAASLKQNINEAKTSLEAIKETAPEEPEEMVKLAKVITEKTQETIEGLEKVKETGLSDNVDKTVTEAQTAVEEAQSASLEVLVKGVAEQTVSEEIVSKDQVKDLLNTTIERENKKIEQISQSVSQVKPTEMVNGSEVEKKVDVDKLAEVTQKSKVSKEILKDAEQLLEADKLAEAFSQVQTSSEINKESKSVVAKVEDALQSEKAKNIQEQQNNGASATNSQDLLIKDGSGEIKSGLDVTSSTTTTSTIKVNLEDQAAKFSPTVDLLEDSSSSNKVLDTFTEEVRAETEKEAENQEAR